MKKIKLFSLLTMFAIIVNTFPIVSYGEETLTKLEKNQYVEANRRMACT